MDKIVENEIANGMLEVVKIKPKCVHALGAVGKPDGGIRPITDCSLPVGKYINDNMEGLVKNFSFKSVDDVVRVMQEGDYISVVDIKSAYRAVSVDPEHSELQGIRWEVDGEEKYLIDRRLCFGLRCAPYYFFLISEFIYNVLSEVFALNVVNYLDDFAAISSTYDEGLLAQRLIIYLLRYLGFHISWSKVSHPSQTATFLGIIIDTVRLELRLPEGKVQKTLNLLKKVNGCNSISRKNLEKLTGLLAHCSTVVRGGRTFCRLGFAVHLGTDWIYGSWSEEKMFDSPCGHLVKGPDDVSCEDLQNINVLELWPVITGLCRWGELLSGHELNVVVDNMQVFYMVKTGRSVNYKCMEWLRRIFWICVTLDIDLCPVYIRSEDNVLADSLSRMLYSSTAKKMSDLVSPYEICCKSGLLSFCRQFNGGAQGQEGPSHEEVGGTVYAEEQEGTMGML